MTVAREGRSPAGRQERATRAQSDARMDEAAELLRALSHPVRLRIIELLSEGEFCVKRLEELLEIPQPSVSQHLSRLRYAGLIESERRGHLVCYRLTEPRGARILKAALGGPAGGRAS
ncbi:MAG: metalloregulator ArsR/SmtB family transcription factor [Candidatus Eisenbacteria bacterium]